MRNQRLVEPCTASVISAKRSIGKRWERDLTLRGDANQFVVEFARSNFLFRNMLMTCILTPKSPRPFNQLGQLTHVITFLPQIIPTF